MDTIGIFHQIRELTHQTVAGLSQEAYFAIPPGFDNNIAWNVGHVIVAQQSLCYRLCGLEMAVSQEQVAMFKPGTSPADWDTEPDMPQLLTQLLELPRSLEADYQNGLFTQFQPYTSGTGIHLETIEDSLAFINFHEGLHLGFIMALKNLVG